MGTDKQLSWLAFAILAASPLHGDDLPRPPEGSVVSTPAQASPPAEPATEPDAVAPAPVTTDIVELNDQFMRLFNGEEYATAAVTGDALIAALRAAPDTDERDLAVALINTATAWRNNGDYDRAIAAYREGIARSEDIHGNLAPELVNPLVGLGLALNAAQAYGPARLTLQRALTVHEANNGFSDPGQNVIRDGLAEAWLGLGNLDEANDEAEIQWEVARRKSERENGYVSAEALPALDKLAGWYRRTGQYEKEVRTYQAAKRIIREAPDQDDLALVEVYRNIGRAEFTAECREYGLSDQIVISDAGNEDIGTRGKRALRAALKIVEEQPEPDPLLQANLLVELGDLYNCTESMGRAVAKYQEAWAILAADPTLRSEQETLLGSPQLLSPLDMPDIYNASGNGPVRAGTLRDGFITANYNVDARGQVRLSQVQIVEAEPAGVLDRKMARKLQQTYHRPAVIDGKTVDMQAPTITHRFSYQGSVRTAGSEQDAGEDLPNPTSSDPLPNPTSGDSG